MAKILTGIVIVALGAGLAPAQASELLCDGLFGEVASGNLRVPRGAICELDGAEVHGNVTVERHATLIAQGTRIAGNLSADDAEVVSVSARSTVGGNIRVGHARVVNVISTRVGGNVQLARIRDEIEIRHSIIGGNLQCSENSRWPDGHGNVVRGNVGGQCADL